MTVNNMRTFGIIFLGGALVASGCKNIGSENDTNRPLLRIEDDSARFDLVQKKQQDENKFQLPTQRKLSDLEQRLRSEYIGLTVEEARSLAQEQNRRFRICFGSEPLTADFIPGRITMYVSDGLVSSIDVEDYGD